MLSLYVCMCLCVHVCVRQKYRASGTDYADAVALPAAVGGGQGGGTFLQVPGLSAALGGAAHRDGVDAVGVAVT